MHWGRVMAQPVRHRLVTA